MPTAPPRHCMVRAACSKCSHHAGAKACYLGALLRDGKVSAPSLNNQNALQRQRFHEVEEVSANAWNLQQTQWVQVMPKRTFLHLPMLNAM